MLAETLSTLGIIEKAVRFYDWIRGKRRLAPETVTTRFIRLFESHGVHRNQVPRFFGHGLTAKDMHNESDLLSKLDETALEAACDMFAVRREWLDGAEEAIYSCHDFYKDPAAFANFLDSLKAKNPDGQAEGILFACRDEALLVLHEYIGHIGDKAIYRYHLLNNWVFSYWKSRAYLAACVAIAWKRGVYVRGVHRDRKSVNGLAQGNRLVGEQGKGLGHPAGEKWDPEDMLLEPAAFLNGVDPERDNFGIFSAIDLWLRLDEQGFMDPGLGMYDRGAIREKFATAVARYRPEPA